jgi:hypothetical protein
MRSFRFLAIVLFAILPGACGKGRSADAPSAAGRCDAPPPDGAVARLETLTARFADSGVADALRREFEEAAAREGKPWRRTSWRVGLLGLVSYKGELKTQRRTDLVPSADAAFATNDGHTYLTAEEIPVVQTVLFCKPRLWEALARNDDDRAADRIFAHELVHAEVLALKNAGVTARFDENEDAEHPGAHAGEHNAAFSGEIDRLLAMVPPPNP